MPVWLWPGFACTRLAGLCTCAARDAERTRTCRACAHPAIGWPPLLTRRNPKQLLATAQALAALVASSPKVRGLRLGQRACAYKSSAWMRAQVTAWSSACCAFLGMPPFCAHPHITRLHPRAPRSLSIATHARARSCPHAHNPPCPSCPRPPLPQWQRELESASPRAIQRCMGYGARHLEHLQYCVDAGERVGSAAWMQGCKEPRVRLLTRPFVPLGLTSHLPPSSSPACAPAGLQDQQPLLCPQLHSRTSFVQRFPGFEAWQATAAQRAQRRGKRRRSRSRSVGAAPEGSESAGSSGSSDGEQAGADQAAWSM